MDEKTIKEILLKGERVTLEFMIWTLKKFEN